MREDLLRELETEYDQIRVENEGLENARKEKIRTEYPEIYTLVLEREELVFGKTRKRKPYRRRWNVCLRKSATD